MSIINCLGPRFVELMSWMGTGKWYFRSWRTDWVGCQSSSVSNLRLHWGDRTTMDTPSTGVASVCIWPRSLDLIKSPVYTGQPKEHEVRKTSYVTIPPLPPLPMSLSSLLLVLYASVSLSDLGFLVLLLVYWTPTTSVLVTPYLTKWYFTLGSYLSCHRRTSTSLMCIEYDLDITLLEGPRPSYRHRWARTKDRRNDTQVENRKGFVGKT